MRQLLAEMSPRLGVRQVPRLRAETPACTKRFGEGRQLRRAGTGFTRGDSQTRPLEDCRDELLPPNRNNLNPPA